MNINLNKNEKLVPLSELVQINRRLPWRYEACQLSELLVYRHSNLSSDSRIRPINDKTIPLSPVNKRYKCVGLSFDGTDSLASFKEGFFKIGFIGKVRQMQDLLIEYLDETDKTETIWADTNVFVFHSKRVVPIKYVLRELLSDYVALQAKEAANKNPDGLLSEEGFLAIKIIVPDEDTIDKILLENPPIVNRLSQESLVDNDEKQVVFTGQNLIGFKNFRKFQELVPQNLGPISIFVGENNAGKSTVVKAILSALDFLKTRITSLDGDSWMNLNFYFNKSYYTHIGTFDRARYNRAPEGAPITFTITVGDRLYEIDVEKSDSESDVFGRVSRLKITLLPFNIDLAFSLKSDRSISVVFHANPYPGYGIEKVPDGYPAKYLQKYFKGLTEDIEMDMGIVSGLSIRDEYVADALLHSFFTRLSATLDNLSSKRISQDELGVFGLSDKTKEFLTKKKSIFRDKYFKVNKQAEINVEYIYAHAVTQTILFSAKDTNDYHVKTIHEYANLQVGLGSPSYEFIIKWMKTFKIGQDYKITSVGGEAHLVKIQNFDGEWVNLADKGMGSIQLMILLFRIATKMAEAGIGYGGKSVISLLIIEEPEQNLHPMLQSELADFFYSLNKDYGFQFIIETHSEYLIRKSQVLVAKEHFASQEELLKASPFKVIYFPSDGKLPYDMLYRTDGKFENEFGHGFFDEASNLVFDIL